MVTRQPWADDVPVEVLSDEVHLRLRGHASVTVRPWQSRSGHFARLAGYTHRAFLTRVI